MGPNYHNESVQRYREGELVRKYGEAAIKEAETNIAIELFIIIGVVKPHELMELVEQACRRADNIRMMEAMGGKT